MVLKKNIVMLGVLLCTSTTFISCNDFLDCEPLDKITPEVYFNTEADLAAYTIGAYDFKTYSGYSRSPLDTDNNTDDMAATDGSTSLWVPGEKRTPEKDGEWNFNNIRKANYFFQQVLPKYEAGSIKGNPVMIRHYIGEMYFLRVYAYFSKLVSLGDFPIVTEVLPDEKGVLMEASRRQPRNKVAHFILEDLDRAIELMSNETDNGKNRLTRNVAYLFKSRVALFEGTWLKYHQGTERVPGGPGWPGAKMDYNKDFTIDINGEVDFFLGEAMKSAAQIADAIPLTPNTGVYNPTTNPYGWNPYFEMFSAVDMEPIEEVLFWRAYDLANGVSHALSSYLAKGGGDVGYTRSLVDACLMKNGLPIYALNSGYAGDLTVENVKTNRDDRLQLFMAAPSDIMRLNPIQHYGMPEILKQAADRCTTGYIVRKCLSYDPAQVGTGAGQINTYGCLIFRAAEAYLNYIEACYEKTHTLDDNAQKYWKEIRKRAGISEDFQTTIEATQLEKENDWSKYSGDQLIDKTLYNIRRERRIELMSEGTRMRDLKRWRSLDKVQNYQVEGFNLWGGEIEKLYVDEKGKSLLVPEGTVDKQPNVSSKENGPYLRVNQIVKTNNLLYNGYTWVPANYLEPIAAIHFSTTASNPDDLESSTIYQNPGWSKVANQPAIGY